MKEIPEALIEQYKERMKELIQEGDAEKAHKAADILLCELLTELGYRGFVDIYNEVTKWYA